MFLLTIYFLYMQLYGKKQIPSIMFSNTLSYELHSSKKYINSNLTGNNCLFPINYTINDEELYKIMILHEKKKKLDILKNINVSINEKLKLLEDNSIKPSSLKAGGLFKDYEDFYF